MLLATVQGKVKRVAVTDLMDQASADPQVIGLDDGDELLWAGISPGGGEFLLVTAQGQAIRFAEDDVRSMGLPAGGIGGVKLAAKDRVVAAVALVKGESPQPHVVLITTLGIGKRVPVADFPAQGRNGQGVVAAKPSPKLGNVAGAALAGPSDTLLCLTAGGGARPIPAAAVPEMGRPAQGKSVIPLVGGDQVTRIVGVALEQRTKAKDEVEVKAEAKTETKTKTTARRAAAKPATGAVKSSAPSKTAAAGKAAPVKSSATAAKKTSGTPPTAASVPKSAAGAATKIEPAVTPPAGSTAKPAVARKAAAGQPSLLAAEAAAPPAETKTRSTAKATPAITDVQKPAMKAEPAKPATKPEPAKSPEKPGDKTSSAPATKSPGKPAAGAKSSSGGKGTT